MSTRLQRGSVVPRTSYMPWTRNYQAPDRREPEPGLRRNIAIPLLVQHGLVEGSSRAGCAEP